MTVPSTARRAGPFYGTGSAVNYPFTFKVFAKEDLEVTVADLDGNESELVLDSGYIVTLNVDQDATPGGYVRYAIAGVDTALPAGYAIAITGDNLEFEQTADLPQGGNFDPTIVENALDNLEMQIQNLRDAVARSLQLGVTTPPDVNITLPAPIAGDLIGWDDTASALRNVDPVTLATIVAFATWQSQTFNGTGAQTAFTLPSDPGNINNLDVTISGVTQTPGLDYTLSGAVLTFVAAPPAGTANILVRYGEALPQGITDAGAVLYDASTNGSDLSVGQRIHRDYINVGDIGGTDPTGTVDNTAKVQAAQATGKLVRLDGFYRVNGSALSLTGPGFVGDGSLKSGLKIATAGHALTIPSNAGYDRRALRLEDFAIDSVGNVCDGHYAIYAPGVAGGAVPVYNSGAKVRGLIVGRNGRMGGWTYLKDFFGFDAEDCAITDVSFMVRVVGSVVQCTFRRIRSNNDSAAATLSKYGLSTETATYSSGVLTPENIRFTDCAYIRGTRGINHTAGLLIDFENFDTEADAFGAVLNATCVVRGGIFVPGIAAAAWVGIMRGVSISDPDDATILEGVDVNCLRAPATPASSYGLDVGDGVSPVYGLVVRDMRVRGIAGSLQSAIRARIMSGDGSFYDNKIRSSVCLGTELDIQSGRTVVVEDNIVPSGIVSVNDAGDATAGGRIVNNTASTLTTTLSSDNWTVYNPGIAGGNTRAVGELKGTFTGTLTGCTTSPTGTLRYVLHGRIVTVFIPSISGTSNSNAATVTGLPAALIPNRDQDQWGAMVDNGNSGYGTYRIKTTGVIELYVGTNYSNFTAAGTKATKTCTVSYSLD